MPLGPPTSLPAQAFGITAVAYLFANWLDYDAAALVLKPMPVLLLLAGVLREGRLGRAGRLGRTAQLVALGLGLSAVGDVLLSWSDAMFVPGLVAFLAAHLAYIGAFVRQDTSPAAGWLVPVAVATGGVFAVLYDGLGEMLAPVAAYVVVITGMAWRAGALVGRVQGGGAAALGALLFVVSDSMLALDRFGHAFPFAGEAVMASYWAAQLWIARSVVARPTVSRLAAAR